MPGCEAEFAKLDVRIVASGGSTSVQTHSRKKHNDKLFTVGSIFHNAQRHWKKKEKEKGNGLDVLTMF